MALNPPQLNPLLSFPDNSQVAEMSIDGIVVDRVYGATGVLDTIQSATTAQYQDPNSNQINPPAQNGLLNQGVATTWYSTLVDDVYNTGFSLAFQFSRTTYVNYVTFDLLNVPCSWTLLQISGTYSPLISGTVVSQGIVNGTNDQGWINFEERLPETYLFDNNTSLVLVINKLTTGTQYQLGVQNFLTKLVVQAIENIEINGSLINSFTTQNSFGFIETFTPVVYDYSNIVPSPLTYDQMVQTLKPLAWWKLNDLAGSLTALDSSGNGYNGTVNGTTNLLTAPNDSFETGVGTWSSGGNSTIAQSSAKALVGTHSLAITATAAGFAYAQEQTTYTNFPAVTPGIEYTWLASFLASTVGSTCYVEIDWLNSSGTLISSVYNSAVDSASTWTKISVSGIAPAGAAYAKIFVIINAQSAGEVHYVDCAGFFQGTNTVWVPAGQQAGVQFGQPGAISGTPSDTAALFDGSTGYVTSSLIGTGSAITLAAWYKVPTSLPGSIYYPRLLAAENYGSFTGASLGIAIGPTGVTNTFIVVGNGTAHVEADSFATFSSGWHHIVGTWDGASVHIYHDGVLMSSTSAPSISWGVTDWSVGGDGLSFIPGEMSEATILPFALSTQQILNLYNAAPQTPAVPNNLYWKCSPQPVKDAVVWFTLDFGQTEVINRMYIDPLYTGCSLNLYWSVDNTNWTPINQDLILHKGMYTLDTICARYLKLEFSQLVPEVYDLPFDSIDRVVQVFPDYVDTYFMGLENALLNSPAQTYNNLVGNSPNVLYNNSPSITSNYGALVGQLTPNQFGGSSTNLGLANLGDNSSTYSVVDPTTSYKNLQDVANEGSIFSNVGGTTFINRRFYQYGPHVYKQILINQTWHEAYFVGIKYLSFYNINQIGVPQ